MMLLPSQAVTKPWGRRDLPPPFENPGTEPVGEIWCASPPQLEDLRVKFIFTSEKLSVQCHPSNAQARAMGHGPKGKDECWFILAAEPGARLAVGFAETVDAPTLRAAALDGSIEELLQWHPVSVGDFFYIPAGTVHAIGAGVALIEVQQSTDITYRLYDYGRPRELHLDAALAVALGTPHPAELRRRTVENESVSLVDGPHFHLDLIAGVPDAARYARHDAPLLVLPLAGAVTAADGTRFVPGQCAHADRLRHLDFASDSRCLIARPAGAE